MSSVISRSRLPLLLALAAAVGLVLLSCASPALAKCEDYDRDCLQCLGRKHSKYQFGGKTARKFGLNFLLDECNYDLQQQTCFTARPPSENDGFQLFIKKPNTLHGQCPEHLVQEASQSLAAFLGLGVLDLPELKKFCCAFLKDAREGKVKNARYLCRPLRDPRNSLIEIRSPNTKIPNSLKASCDTVGQQESMLTVSERFAPTEEAADDYALYFGEQKIASVESIRGTSEGNNLCSKNGILCFEITTPKQKNEIRVTFAVDLVGVLSEDPAVALACEKHVPNCDEQTNPNL